MSSRVATRVASSMDSSVYSSASTRRARMMCQSCGKSVESRQTRLREDARADGPHQCCSGHDKCKCRQRGFPHTASSCNECRQVEMWQLDEWDSRIKAWEAREIQLEVRVGANRECLSKLVTRLKHDRIDDDGATKRFCAIACFHSTPQTLEYLR